MSQEREGGPRGWLVGGPLYFRSMPSVADDLRTRTTARVLALPVRARIALALALGDDDLALFARSSGLDPATALRRLCATRQHGRAASACGQGPVR